MKHLCHEQSHLFDVGMKKVSNVLIGMREVKDTTMLQRDQLSKFRGEMAAQILRVTMLKVKQQRVKEIQKVMHQVIGKYSTQVLHQVYEMINTGDFVGALGLIRKAQSEIYADFQEALPQLEKGELHNIKILDLIHSRLG